MVHAQLNCRAFEPVAHSDDTVVNHANGYQRRSTLSSDYGGDVYAAMSCFGLCAETVAVGGKSAATAADEVALIRNVRREVIRNCTVAYDKDRDGLLYSGTLEVKGIPDPETGIIKARHTGAGAHFIETAPDADTSLGRLDNAIERATRAYGLGLDPLLLDEQDVIYVVDNGHVHVPVLRYDDTVCIDYTSGTCIPGIMALDGSGVPRVCTTRDLYSLPNHMDVLYVDPAHGFEPYTRRIQSANPAVAEPAAHETDTLTSIYRLIDWLAIPQDELSTGMGYLTIEPNPLDDEGNEIPGRMMYGRGDARAALPDVLSTIAGGGDRSLLGAPLPLQIVSEEVDPVMKATVRVAPLGHAGNATHSASVTDERAGVDLDELAARVSRTGARNVIGIAMQKIDCNTQGDLMLHDGV